MRKLDAASAPPISTETGSEQGADATFDSTDEMLAYLDAPRAWRWDRRRTLFSCHHPAEERVVSSCGWVESCRACRETRFTESHGVAGGFWQAASREEWRENGVCRGYAPGGKLMYVREGHGVV